MYISIHGWPAFLLTLIIVAVSSSAFSNQSFGEILLAWSAPFLLLYSILAFFFLICVAGGVFLKFWDFLHWPLVVARILGHKANAFQIAFRQPSCKAIIRTHLASFITLKAGSTAIIAYNPHTPQEVHRIYFAVTSIVQIFLFLYLAFFPIRIFIVYLYEIISKFTL